MSLAVEIPTAFDAASFVADLVEAGCRVVLSRPATTFEGVERPATYFIAPCAGYTGVMAKWADTMAACPDPHERVTARLVELNGWAA